WPAHITSSSTSTRCHASSPPCSLWRYGRWCSCTSTSGSDPPARAPQVCPQLWLLGWSANSLEGVAIAGRHPAGRSVELDVPRASWELDKFGESLVRRRHRRRADSIGGRSAAAYERPAPRAGPVLLVGSRRWAEAGDDPVGERAVRRVGVLAHQGQLRGAV